MDQALLIVGYSPDSARGGCSSISSKFYLLSDALTEKSLIGP